MRYFEIYYGFAFKEFLSISTAGSVAETIGFPFNTVKVRLQLQGEYLEHGNIEKRLTYYKGTVDAIRTIIRDEGLRSLFRGLTSVYQRQMIYHGVRAFIHYPVRNFYYEVSQKFWRKSFDDISIRLPTNLTTSALAVMCCQPVNVIKLNLQNNSLQYKSECNAAQQILSRDGITGLWRGSSPVLIRSSIYIFIDNMYFDTLQEKFINEYKFGHMPAYMITCMITCGLTVLLSNPIDVIRTRYVTALPDEYKGIFQCAKRTLLREGPLAFYKGITASYYCTIIWDISIYFLYERMKDFLDEMTQSQK